MLAKQVATVIDSLISEFEGFKLSPYYQNLDYIVGDYQQPGDTICIQYKWGSNVKLFFDLLRKRLNSQEMVLEKPTATSKIYQCCEVSIRTIIFIHVRKENEVLFLKLRFDFDVSS